MPLRSTLTTLVAAVAVLSLGACDTTEDTALDVSVVDLSFAFDDYDVGGDDRTVTYDARTASVSRGDLDFALEQAGDGALVMLYIDVELVSPVEGAEDNTTWAALPLSRSFDELVLTDDVDGDGEPDTIPVVGYTVSYEYSFDNEDLYFDVVSSAPSADFPSLTQREFFNTITPIRVLDPDDADIDLRLVVIPDELFFVDGQAGARIDLRDYQAVKAAYGLPD